jgi:hypothetical protein
MVFDREGDIFEAMEVMAPIGHSYVIRAQRNRLVEKGLTDYDSWSPASSEATIRQYRLGALGQRIGQRQVEY